MHHEEVINSMGSASITAAFDLLFPIEHGDGIPQGVPTSATAWGILLQNLLRLEPEPEPQQETPQPEEEDLSSILDSWDNWQFSPPIVFYLDHALGSCAGRIRINGKIDRNHRINGVESDVYSFLCNCMNFSRCRNGRFSQEMV